MHTRPALYQGSYSPVPYRYFKVRLLACYPIFPRPPSPLCCTWIASITAIVKKCVGILASFLVSQPDFAWTESKGSFMSLKEELVLEPGRRHTRERGLLLNSVRVFSRDSCLVCCSLPGGERQVTSTIQPGLVSNWGRTLEHLSPLAGLCPHK